MPPRRKTADPDTAFAYVRVSTAEQVDSGLGLDAQRTKVVDECERRGWRLLNIYDDGGLSGKNITDRPELNKALEALDRGEAANLVTAKLDRLSRSVHDFTGLVARADRNGWSLIVLDLGVDTSTPTGDMMANVMASFAQFERKLIGQRTSDALQVKRRAGVQLGRPQRSDPAVVAHIVEQRIAGRSMQAIADDLTEREVPTSQGGRRWYASTVAAVLRRPEAVAALEAAS